MPGLFWNTQRMVPNWPAAGADGGIAPALGALQVTLAGVLPQLALTKLVKLVKAGVASLMTRWRSTSASLLR